MKWGVSDKVLNKIHRRKVRDDITDRFSSYISTQNTTRADFILGFIVLVLFYICWRFYIPLSEVGQYTTDIDLGYSAKQYEQGYYYVVDSGHSRLIHFDENSNIDYEINDVSDGESSGLYIDDFTVDNGLTYISASEWDGMLVSKEVILVFDKDKYVRTIAARDYSEKTINKHRFHGVNVQNNILHYIEAEDMTLLVHNVNLETDEDKIQRVSCFDAYNVISDCVFLDSAADESSQGKFFVLQKSGAINSVTGEKVEQVYSTKWANETERIPYDMAVSKDGEIYFIDIRAQEVVKVNAAAKNTTVLADQTDSATVNISNTGNEFLIVDLDGLKVISDTEKKTFLTLN